MNFGLIGSSGKESYNWVSGMWHACPFELVFYCICQDCGIGFRALVLPHVCKL